MADTAEFRANPGAHSAPIAVRSERDLQTGFVRTALHWLARHRLSVATLLGSLVVISTAIQVEMFEFISAFAEQHEEWQVDEIFSTLIVAAVALLGLLAIRARQLRQEIGARESAEQAAHALARHDPLTGLPNRRVLAEHLSLTGRQRRACDRELAVLVVDLDRFKPVNDIHGHAAGDRVLTEVADRISQLIAGSCNGLLARLGGDEFACVIEHPVGSDAPIRLAKQIVSRLGEPIAIGPNAVLIGASVGISVCPDGAIDGEELLRSADIAMYRAKREGRSTFRSFETSMDAELQMRAALERDLRLAISNREIIPHYQPITRLPDGEIVGFEALARWDHPDHGEIIPDTFIPIAEDAGLIDDLTFNLLGQACVDAKAWPASMSLSVNISPVQLKNRWLAARLLQTVTEGGLAPARLIVEITESSLVSDFDAARHVIGSLKSAGVQVALDDFGTGFSSLSHLRELKFDRIKIDRSFVRDLAEPDTGRLVKAIIGLGESLGIAVTAEGIETKAGFDQLAKLGCDFGQGFFMGRPVSASESARIFVSNPDLSAVHVARGARRRML